MEAASASTAPTRHRINSRFTLKLPRSDWAISPLAPAPLPDPVHVVHGGAERLEINLRAQLHPSRRAKPADLAEIRGRRIGTGEAARIHPVQRVETLSTELDLPSPVLRDAEVLQDRAIPVEEAGPADCIAAFVPRTHLSLRHRCEAGCIEPAQLLG